MHAQQSDGGEVIMTLLGADTGESASDAAAAGREGIPRPRRIAVGQKCKALIDRGRLAWLQELGCQAESVLYVPPDVSGENRLLLATP